MIDGLDKIRDKVLFVSYGGGHAAALAPVARELERRGVPIAILGLTTAAAYFKRQGLPAFGIADLIGAVPGYADAAATGRILAADQPRHAAVSVRESEAYLGVGYAALAAELGSTEAARRYAQLGRQAFCPVGFFRRLFDVSRPAAVIATSAPRSERASIEAAAAARVPSLCLVDLYAPFEIEWCAAEGYADLICVLNEAVAERFRARGIPDTRIAVTGNPAFDRLGTLNVISVREQHRATLGLADADRLLLWISQPEPTVHPFTNAPGDPALPAKIEKTLAAAFRSDDNVHLIMRLHPSEDRGPAVSGPRLRYGTSDEPLDALLCAADCVATCSSTVGLEAALLGRPVVQIMESIVSEDLPLAELGFAIAAPTAYQAGAPIREILGTVVAREPHSSSGRPTFDAAERVTNLILGLLQKST